MAVQVPFLGGAPFPVIEIAIEPATQADADRLSGALSSLAGDDPLFGVSTDAESGQIILGGISESQLDRKIEALKRVEGLQINVGAPQVAYRETLGQVAEIDHVHRRQSGGSGQFARVRIRFEPGAPASGFRFTSEANGDAIPKEYVWAVERGLDAARNDGLLAGFPVTDFIAALTDAAFHDLDSSPQAFEIASRAAFRRLGDKARPRLLEPIMKIEVTTPEVHLGAVIGDLKLRRGAIRGQDTRGETYVLLALVPLANLFGYEAQLKSLAGEGSCFRMAYSHYEPVPLEPDDDPTFRPSVGMRA